MKESDQYIREHENKMPSVERFNRTLDVYKHEGEEYRLFSYQYREAGDAYYTAYFFPRRKGPAFPAGFVVMDQQGEAVSRELAVAINEAMNRYNLLFKRFQNEWGDVVEQDLRKYEAALPHFEALDPISFRKPSVKERINERAGHHPPGARVSGTFFAAGSPGH